MKKLLIIGSLSSQEAESIEWIEPFYGLEQHDFLIIDLTSFPKDYPKTLFKNIGILKRATRLFMRDNKEIFCIMERPFKILFKQIPLNYSWLPFPQKLKVNPMLLGKTVYKKSERFAEYFDNVEKWDNELFWKNTKNCSFEPIAVNKSNNPIAATITINERGKIHFFPKITNLNSKKTMDLLIKYAQKPEIRKE